MTGIKADRPVNFKTFAWIENTQLRGCTRCGATVLRHTTAPGGDLMELVHREYHKEQDAARRAER